MTVAFKLDDCGTEVFVDKGGFNGTGWVEDDAWVEEEAIELTEDRGETLSDKDSLASLYPREFLGSFFFLDFFWTLSKEFFDAFLWRGCDLCC